MTARFETAHLSVLVEALPDPSLVVGENGVIVAANGHAHAFFGGAALGQHFSTLLRAPAILEAVSDALLQSKAALVSHSVRTPVPRSYDVHVSPMGVNDKSERLALLILHDLTYEEQIERMRSDFVANASHELRTPLASLSGFIETMQGAAKNDTKAKDKFLNLMKVQADRMASLIDDLLSLSRIEISEHLAPTAMVDLAFIAKQASELLAPLAADAKCEIRIDLPQSLPVIGDSHQLLQVVHNLIENAIKYAGTGKSVEIGGAIQNDLVVLSVRDYGPGIASHHVPRLTERFYRVSIQDSRNRGGTGLGLAICKHIINRHRGKLVIDSELDKGSVFSIHLSLMQ